MPGVLFPVPFRGGKASDGGVLNVELGSSARFLVMATFEHNSIQAAYSGGAVYAGGNVRLIKNFWTNLNLCVRYIIASDRRYVLIWVKG